MEFKIAVHLYAKVSEVLKKIKLTQLFSEVKHCVPIRSKWLTRVLELLVWIFMLSLMMLKPERKDISNLTTIYVRLCKVLPAKQARCSILAGLLGKTYGKVIYGSPLTEDLAYPTNRGFQLSANFCQSNPNTTNCCNLIPQGPGHGGWSLVSKEVWTEFSTAWCGHFDMHLILAG